MAEMNDLCALRLDQPAHDVDRGIVPVEQRGGSNESQRSRSLGVCLGQRVSRLGGQGRSPSFLGKIRNLRSVQQANLHVTLRKRAKMSIAIIAIYGFWAYRKG
jgi:hypothetical protein